jgi:hypothetical protein
MTPLRLIFCLGLLALSAACATAPAIGEIPGLAQFKQPCPNEPAILSDEEAIALADTMPSAELRERGYWAPNALALRACVLYERQRADSAVAAAEAFNQAVRDSN